MKIHNNINIVNIGIEYGCRTVRDLANFLKVYNPEIVFNDRAKELVYIASFK